MIPEIRRTISLWLLERALDVLPQPHRGFLALHLAPYFKALIDTDKVERGWQYFKECGEKKSEDGR